MSEKFTLKVPETNLTEFISQGNHSAELTANGTVETDSREFADYLISKHGCVEVASGDDSLAAELGKLTIAQLLEKAAEANIENAKQLKKGELIAAIIAASTKPNGGTE
jgi:hypothetical protein